jgi:hypothetical protein
LSPEAFGGHDPRGKLTGIQRAAGERFLARLPRPLEAATNIDVGRDFFDVAIASGSFGISLASPILSFTFHAGARNCERLDYLQRHQQAIGAGQPVHRVSGYKDLVAALL